MFMWCERGGEQAESEGGRQRVKGQAESEGFVLPSSSL